MKCQVAAGFALATLVAAPLAFSDHFRDMVREPAEGRFQRAVAFPGYYSRFLRQQSGRLAGWRRFEGRPARGRAAEG